MEISSTMKLHGPNNFVRFTFCAFTLIASSSKELPLAKFRLKTPLIFPSKICFSQGKPVNLEPWMIQKLNRINSIGFWIKLHQKKSNLFVTAGNLQ